MVPGFSSVHLPSLQPRDHPPRLRGEVVESATLFAIRVVRYRLVEREGVASRLEAVAPIGAPERRRPAVDVPHACDAEHFGAPELGAPEVGAPEVGAPEVGAPEVGAPEVGAPEVGAPEVGAPEVGAPEVGAPEVGAPEVGAPEVGALLDRDLDGNTPGLCLDAEQDGAGKAVLDLDLHRSLLHPSWQPMRTRSAHAPPFGPRASWRMISGSGVIAWSGGACRAS